MDYRSHNKVQYRFLIFSLLGAEVVFDGNLYDIAPGCVGYISLQKIYKDQASDYHFCNHFPFNKKLYDVLLVFTFFL